MTLMGKIFTVMITIMSAVFMSFAVVVYATHTNWHKLVDNPPEAVGEYGLGLTQQVAQQENINTQLRNEIEKLKNAMAVEQAGRRFALAGLQSKLSGVEEKLSDSEKLLASSQAREDIAVEAMGINTRNMEKLVADLDNLRTEIRKTQEARDQKFTQVVDLTDKLNSNVGLLRNLTEIREQLVTQVSELKRVMDAHGLTVNDAVERIPPSLDGVVTAVSEKAIEISLGSDDGLRTGHMLDVFRNRQYLGRVVVRQTSPNRAVAAIIKEYQKGIMRKGDRVATKVSA